jgi:outer membrane protein TolC
MPLKIPQKRRPYRGSDRGNQRRAGDAGRTGSLGLVQLRGAQALNASQLGNVRTTQAAFDLTQTRQRQGLATDLDVEQARTQLAVAQSQLPTYEKQAEQAMNRLSVLTGQPPGALDAMRC